jgi:hypothetical protein
VVDSQEKIVVVVVAVEYTGSLRYIQTAEIPPLCGRQPRKNLVVVDTYKSSLFGGTYTKIGTIQRYIEVRREDLCGTGKNFLWGPLVNYQFYD